MTAPFYVPCFIVPMDEATGIWIVWCGIPSVHTNDAPAGDREREITYEVFCRHTHHPRRPTARYYPPDGMVQQPTLLVPPTLHGRHSSWDLAIRSLDEHHPIAQVRKDTVRTSARCQCCAFVREIGRSSRRVCPTGCDGPFV